MIYLRPRNGVCNRLRAIASARALAHACGDELCVYWVDDEGMNERFSNLFAAPADFRIVEDREERMDRLFTAENAAFFAKDEFCDAKKVAEMLDRVQHKSPAEDYSIESYSSFFGSHDYSWLRPNQQLQRAVDMVSRHFGKSCVGLHIRRTDNVKCRAYSPIDIFIERIQAEITGDPQLTFFLATDSETDRKVILNRFGSRVITRNGVATRYARNGVIDGVIDLFLLSKTRRIYGSYWSSFSEEAACIGGVPRVILKDEWRNAESKIADLNDRICNLLLGRLEAETHVVGCRDEFKEMENLRRSCQALQAEVAALKSSESYRVGLLVTWPLRKLVRFLAGDKNA